MLVDQARHDQVVLLRRKPGGGDVALEEASVDAPRLRDLEHLRREVDAVDAVHAAASHPRPGPTGPATEVGRGAHIRPRDLAQRAEQLDVHRVLDGLLVGRDPLAVARANVDRPVAACVEEAEIRHTND
jgi:hypothetical protein